ncbi:MAG: chaperone modulator CbpM [Castellaniella sp.]
MKMTKSLWLSATEFCSMEQVLELSGLSGELFEALVDAGVIQPHAEAATDVVTQRMFASDCIVQARQARRLRDDFELDAHGLTLAMTLLERIRMLEARLEALEAQRPRR